MITNAKEEWLPELVELWQEAFGDGEEEIQRFHKCFYEPSLTWCYEAAGKPVAVIYGIPALLWLNSNGKKQPVIYLYAGATKKAYRGKGYYSEVIKAASKEKPNGGIPLLVPVQELIGYYERLGFHLIADEKDEMLDFHDFVETINSLPITIGEATISPITYKQIRDKRLGNAGYVEWSQRFFSYVLESIGTGVARKVTLGEEEHILLGKVESGCLRIIETTLSTEQIKAAGKYLLKYFQCSHLCMKGTILMSTQREWNTTPYFKIPLDE